MTGKDRAAPRATSGPAGRSPEGASTEARRGGAAPPARAAAPVGVRVEALTAGYGRGPFRRDVLRGISLTADPGRVTAVVGPNGVGKTTLFRVLLGLLVPRSGTVSVEGWPPGRFRRRCGVAYLPERTPVPGGWTFRSLIEEGCDLHGLRGLARRRAVELARERSGLDPRDRRAALSKLSNGLARRAVLAFALLGRPALVLLDEPLSGLDPGARARLREVVRDVAAGGATVLLASHELGEVGRMADRAIVLGDGTVTDVVEGPTSAGALERAVVGVRGRREDGRPPEAVLREPRARSGGPA